MQRAMGNIFIGAVVWATASVAPSAQQGSQCEGWLTEWFFEEATGAKVQACLDGGANPLATVPYGETTPLHLAAIASTSPAVVEVLLNAGADPMVRDALGATPLHKAAARSTSPEVIEALLLAGADPIAPDESGYTPLDMALLEAGNPAAVKTLIDSGADASAVLKWSPLHMAVLLNKRASVIEALITSGASPAALDVDGRTPLHLAAGYNEDPAVVEVLIAAWADVGARSDFYE